MFTPPNRWSDRTMVDDTCDNGLRSSRTHAQVALAFHAFDLGGIDPVGSAKWDWLIDHSEWLVDQVHEQAANLLRCLHTDVTEAVVDAVVGGVSDPCNLAVVATVLKPFARPFQLYPSPPTE